MKNSIVKMYSEPYWKQKRSLEVKIKEYNDTFTLELTDSKGKPDCCIGHFGYNFYFRTAYGLKYKKYKNIKTLFHAIRLSAKAKGLTVESIGINKYYRYRPVVKVN